MHIPLSGQNIHALLSYVVTKRAAGSEHRPEIVISEAKLGVRRVPRGFKLHHCSWARYRSTDFITFAIPELTHTCVTSTLPTCWHSAKEYRTLLSPYPRKPVGVAPKHRGIALAEHHTTVPTVQPEQSAHQKPLVTQGIWQKRQGYNQTPRTGNVVQITLHVGAIPVIHSWNQISRSTDQTWRNSSGLNKW